MSELNDEIYDYSIQEDELTYYYMISSSLSTNKYYDESDVNMVCNYLVNIYTNNRQNREYIHSKIIKFCVYTDLKGVSKFALTFNQKIMKYIKEKNMDSLESIIFTKSEQFAEIYENKYLSSSQQNYILLQLNKEFQAMELFYSISNHNIDQIITNMKNSCYGIECFNNLKEFCYDDVCIQSCDKNCFFSKITSNIHRPPCSVYTIDKPQNSEYPVIYNFNIINLLIAMMTNQINPLSGYKFSDYTILAVNRRFPIEILMVKYFLETH